MLRRRAGNAEAAAHARAAAATAAGAHQAARCAWLGRWCLSRWWPAAPCGPPCGALWQSPTLAPRACRHPFWRRSSACCSQLTPVAALPPHASSAISLALSRLVTGEEDGRGGLQPPPRHIRYRLPFFARSSSVAGRRRRRRCKYAVHRQIPQLWQGTERALFAVSLASPRAHPLTSPRPQTYKSPRRPFEAERLDAEMKLVRGARSAAHRGAPAASEPAPAALKP